MNIFEQLDKTLVDYYVSKGISEQNLHCKYCGGCVFDIEYAKHIRARMNAIKEDKPLKNAYFTRAGTVIKYEPEQMRWILKGKKINDHVYFRKVCWKCFYDHLNEYIDVPRAARKSKWYTRILSGERPIPPSEVAASDYFRMLFDVSEEDLKAQKAKVAVSSRSHFIDKYGEHLGEVKYKEYCVRQAYTCSKEYMMNEKGMTEQEWKDFNNSRSTTKEHLIQRYGLEDGTRRWNEYCAYEAYAGNSLMWFTDKYGQEEGTKKYQELCDKKLFIGRTYSKVSQELFKKIDDAMGEAAKESRWEEKNFEFELKILASDGTQRLKKVDYCLGSKIIEFNGKLWHADPRSYREDDVIQLFGRKPVKVKDIWARDAERLEALKKAGYEVHVVWEADYCNDPLKVINECVEFLTKK